MLHVTLSARLARARHRRRPRARRRRRRGQSACAHLGQPGRRRLPLQLRADEQRRVVSHRRRSGGGALRRCVLPVPDARRRLLALDRPGALGFRQAGQMAVRRPGGAGHPGRRRQAVPDAVGDAAGAAAVFHRSRARPLAVLDPHAAAGARPGVGRPRERDEAGRPAARPVGSGPVPRRGRQDLPVLGFVQHLPALRRADRPGAGPRRRGRRQAGALRQQAAGAAAPAPGPARLGALRPGPHRQQHRAVRRGRLDEPPRRHLLPAVRRARHRVQRLRHRRLHQRQAARSVPLRAVQPDRLQARRLRGRRRPRLDLRRRLRQQLEHRHHVGRA